MSDTSGESATTPHDEGGAQVRTFLIADIRGYTSFTHERGDEAAAALATAFAALVRDVVVQRTGRVVELRGDEALSVFESARQALRAATELQERFAQHSAEHTELPLGVGIGVDAGEAVPVEHGYRGAALNVAARLCSLAGPGEVLASEAVTHLAGRIDAIRYIERGGTQFKGISKPIHVIAVEPASQGSTALVTSDGAILSPLPTNSPPPAPQPPQSPAPAAPPVPAVPLLGDLENLGDQISALVRDRVGQRLDGLGIQQTALDQQQRELARLGREAARQHLRLEDERRDGQSQRRDRRKPRKQVAPSLLINLMIAALIIAVIVIVLVVRSHGM